MYKNPLVKLSRLKRETIAYKRNKHKPCRVKEEALRRALHRLFKISLEIQGFKPPSSKTWEDLTMPVAKIMISHLLVSLFIWFIFLLFQEQLKERWSFVVHNGQVGNGSSRGDKYSMFMSEPISNSPLIKVGGAISGGLNSPLPEYS